MSEVIRLPYRVPYYAQIASRELATAIFSEGLDPRLDPRWAETGARSPEEYAHWVERACGIVCVKMCAEALGSPVRCLMDWIETGLQHGGYLIVKNEAGQDEERGWIHRVMAELLREQGAYAEPMPASVDDIVAHLRQEHMVIASVSYEVGDELPITKKGGHLVVITGVELQDGTPTFFTINNPSGRRLDLQDGARIPVGRFVAGYTGRIIAVGTKNAC